MRLPPHVHAELQKFNRSIENGVQCSAFPTPRHRRYFLSPLAEGIVRRFIPTWVAPNLITLLGLLFPVASLVIFAWTSSSDFSDEPPRWAFFFNAFALFAYQTLDNMDGKQVCGSGWGGFAWRG